MPIYYGRSVGVRVSIASLDATSIRQNGGTETPEPTSATDRIRATFDIARELMTQGEDAVLDPKTGSHIWFLGDRTSTPLIMVSLK